MEETRQQALQRARRKRDDRSAEEFALWAQQMGMVREAARLSGIERWTREHTIGALFACQALQATLVTLRQLGAIDPMVAHTMRHAVQEQELIAALMEEEA
jgi:hypothetical protein